MSQRTPRDIAWILLLSAVALMGILSLYQRIHHAQSKGEVNLCALITQRPQAILRVLRPELLRLMLPSTPHAEQLLASSLPNNVLCQLNGADKQPPFTLIYYPEGEVWLAALSYIEAQSLFNRLNENHGFAPTEEEVWKQVVRYYPEEGKRFLGCTYRQGIFMASYQRKLLLSTLRQALRPQPLSPEIERLRALGNQPTDAPLQLYLPTETLLNDSLAEVFFGAERPAKWLSIPFFFNDGNLCGLQEWPLPQSLPDSLIAEQWLHPLRDSLRFSLHRLLPEAALDLQASHDEQATYFTLYAH